jgi:hypothetical protein
MYTYMYCIYRGIGIQEDGYDGKMSMSIASFGSLDCKLYSLYIIIIKKQLFFIALLYICLILLS